MFEQDVVHLTVGIITKYTIFLKQNNLNYYAIDIK